MAEPDEGAGADYLIVARAEEAHSDDGLTFPLDTARNKEGILQLYSLMKPLSAITRDGQYGKVPMTAEVHVAFGQAALCACLGRGHSGSLFLPGCGRATHTSVQHGIVFAGPEAHEG